MLNAVFNWLLNEGNLNVKNQYHCHAKLCLVQIRIIFNMYNNQSCYINQTRII